jgi:hypothetical protein
MNDNPNSYRQQKIVIAGGAKQSHRVVDPALEIASSLRFSQ